MRCFGVSSDFRKTLFCSEKRWISRMEAILARTSFTVPHFWRLRLINRTHAAAALITAGLAVGATTMVVAQDVTSSASTDLYKKGLDLLQAGSTRQAKEALERVDPLQLPEADRAAYFTALKQAQGAPGALRPAPVPGVTKTPVVPVNPPEQPGTNPPSKPATGDPLANARDAKAAALMAAGDDAMSKKLYAQAAQSYGEAHDLAPEDTVIAGKLAAARSEQSKHSGSTLSVETRMYEVEHQKAVSQFKTAIEDAKAHLAARDYVGANRMVSVARAQSNEGRNWLSVREYEDMQDEAAALGAMIDADALQRDLEAQKLKQSATESGANVSSKEDKAARVNHLLITARALQRNGQNEQALAAAEQALAADPGNIAADMLTEMLRDELYLRRSDYLLKQKANHTATLGLENREAVIPYTDLLTYPTDWPQLSERRITASAGANVESDVDRNTRHLLDEKIIENSAFNGDSLETALNFVRDATGANMVVLWGAIEAAGIKKDKAVTQPLKHVSAAQLLRVILEGVSTELEGENRLGYAIEGGIIKVATKKELKNTTTENVYDIRDLLVQVPTFTDAPSFSLADALKSSSGGAAASIFDDATAAPDKVSESTIIEELTTRIKEHVGTKAEWDDNLSVISAYHGQLLVKTTPENHRSLAKLLENFRQTRSVQIAVESRFLVVDNNFLEEFGVDMDMAFAGNNGLSPINVKQNSAPNQVGGGTGMAARPSSDLTPASFKSSGGGASPQALTLGASYLSDLQVDLLVSATQAHKTGITLTASSPPVRFAPHRPAWRRPPGRRT
jgi:tetratricopeptide (TPR) repeat protein